jgi:hypothetical protein
VNRRRHRRIVVALPARVGFPWSDRLSSARVIDVSIGGARIRCRASFLPDDRLLTLVFQAESLLVTDGYVVDCVRLPDGDCEIQLKFSHLSPSARGRLCRMVPGLTHTSTVEGA